MILALHYRLGTGAERTFLAPSFDFVVGSDPSCELMCDDPLVEPRHARFFSLFGSWWVEPCGTDAVVRIGGQRVQEATPLVPERAVRVGPLTVRPEFTPRFADAADPEGTVVAMSSGESQPPALHERARLALLLAIHKAIAEQSGRQMLDALALALATLIPGTAASVLVNAAGELLPVAWTPRGSATVSFTLARRAAYLRRGFVWERALATAASQRIDSLASIASALYCPVVAKNRVYGVFAVSSGSLDRSLDAHDLDLVTEVARIAVDVFRQFASDGPQGPATTFVSYSHVDRDTAVRIAQALRREGISVWMDDRLRPGERWREQLANAIRTADCATVCLSPDSLRSKVVRWEVGVAKRAGKIVLPVIVAGDPELSDAWRSIHYLDLRGASNEAILTLARRIEVIANDRGNGE